MYTNPAINFGYNNAANSPPVQLPFRNSYSSIMDETLFRNRPDNAFWSVPNGMVLDDWLAYLLPQQSNPESNDTNTWDPNHQNWM